MICLNLPAKITLILWTEKKKKKIGENGSNTKIFKNLIMISFRLKLIKRTNTNILFYT